MLNVVVYKVRQKSDMPPGFGFFPCPCEKTQSLPRLLEAFNDLPAQATVVVAREFWGFGRIVAVAFPQSYPTDDWMMSLHDVDVPLAERLAQRRRMFRVLGTALGS